MASTIAVEELRVGMYIHLEGGWLSHPFPLSSFRIASDDQIATLRGLGLARVKWVPEKSVPATVPGELTGDTERAAEAAAPSAELRAERQRQAALAAQRDSARRCERQYGEAAQAWRETVDKLVTHPQQAGRATEDLTQAMLDKMLVAEDIGVRLVNGGGDRVASHALNVSVISLLIGRTLGLVDGDLLDLGVGALLHDIGKQSLPERNRHAEEGQSVEDRQLYRDHVAKGLQLGRRMELSAGAMTVLAQHHEHADGSGFPLGLTAERMSMAARIVAIVDRYDKLCNPLVATQALTPHEAVATLFAHGRSQYDASVLNTFIRMMGVYPAGSLVQLTDDRYAMVVGSNSSRPLKPRVLAHEPAGQRSDARLLDLERLPDLGIRRSLPASKVPLEALQVLDPRPRVAYYFEPIAREWSASELAA